MYSSENFILHRKQMERINAEEIGEIFESTAKQQLKDYSHFYEIFEKNYDTITSNPVKTKLNKEDLYSLALKFFETVDPQLSTIAGSIIALEGENGMLDKGIEFALIEDDLSVSSDCISMNLGGIGGVTEEDLKNIEEKDPDLYNEMINLIQDRRVAKITVTRNGSILDLYTLVHEFTHYFVMRNNKSLGMLDEVPSYFMERMVDDFLFGLSDEECRRYNFDRTQIKYDTLKARVFRLGTTYFGLKRFNKNARKEETIPKTEKDFMYALAQIYCSQFVEFDAQEKRKRVLDIINIGPEEDALDRINEIMGINWNNNLKRNFYILKTVNDGKLLLDKCSKRTQETAKKMQARIEQCR